MRLVTVEETHRRVLVVEDDDRIRASLRLALRDEGHEVVDFADAESALEHFREQPAELVLVDVMLPAMSGLDLCRALRTFSAVPIVMLTARDDSHDVVAGLEAGADDYVTKPYNVKELAARIRSLLRRTSGILEVMAGTSAGAKEADDTSASELTFGTLVFEVDAGVVRRGDDVIDLTSTEYRLLCELVENQRRVLSREQLLESVWGYDYYGDVRVVDAHVRRLRKKIELDPAEPRLVVTVRGLGYRFDPDGEG